LKKKEWSESVSTLVWFSTRDANITILNKSNRGAMEAKNFQLEAVKESGPNIRITYSRYIIG
jgi:hypothetical protein